MRRGASGHPPVHLPQTQLHMLWLPDRRPLCSILKIRVWGGGVNLGGSVGLNVRLLLSAQVWISRSWDGAPRSWDRVPRRALSSVCSRLQVRSPSPSHSLYLFLKHVNKLFKKNQRERIIKELANKCSPVICDPALETRGVYPVRLRVTGQHFSV